MHLFSYISTQIVYIVTLFPFIYLLYLFAFTWSSHPVPLLLYLFVYQHAKRKFLIIFLWTANSEWSFENTQEMGFRILKVCCILLPPFFLIYKAWSLIATFEVINVLLISQYNWWPYWPSQSGFGAHARSRGSCPVHCTGQMDQPAPVPTVCDCH